MRNIAIGDAAAAPIITQLHMIGVIADHLPDPNH